MILLLLGCSDLPAGIESKPGEIHEYDLPDLVVAASPDLPYLLLSTLVRLAYEDYRDCPRVDLTVGIAVQADTCNDSAFVSWDGSAAAVESGSIQSFSFSDLAVGLENAGGEGNWTADGTITATPWTTAAGAEIRTKILLTSRDGDELPMWVDTSGALTAEDDAVFFDRYTGTIGLGTWGTAEIEGVRLPLAQAVGCSYAAHRSGTLRIQGKNAADLYFVDEALAVSAPPPFTDTGRDTGDTGGIPVEEEWVGSTSFDANGEDCGLCIAASIAGELVPECVVLERTLAYPFVAL